MNYIQQIKEFWIAQEGNPLSTTDIALYFYLLEVCNKCSWAGQFKRNNAKVQADLSISFKTLQSSRDKLSEAGFITYKTQNGVPNVSYSVVDLCKISRGSGAGNGRGSGAGSGEGASRGNGRDNINQTKLKPNQAKPNIPGETPAKKKKDFWKEFVDTFHDWYSQQNNGQEYAYMKKDFKHLELLYDFLKKRAEIQKWEFTQKSLCDAFKYFLNEAWNKDNWLRKNFSIPNILSQFNQIVNAAARTTDSTQRQNAASKVNGEQIHSAFNKFHQQRQPAGADEAN